MRDGSGGSSLIAEGVGSSEGDTGRLGAKHTEFKNTCMARESSAQSGTSNENKSLLSDYC